RPALEDLGGKLCALRPVHTPPNAYPSWGRRAPRQHAEPRGAVPDARRAVLHRGALLSWREHSTGHACPASHAPRTSRPSMSRAGIASTRVFVVPPGTLLELWRSCGALSPIRGFSAGERHGEEW